MKYTNLKGEGLTGAEIVINLRGSRNYEAVNQQFVKFALGD
jgi:hypothetical protein